MDNKILKKPEVEIEVLHLLCPDCGTRLKSIVCDNCGCEIETGEITIDIQVGEILNN